MADNPIFNFQEYMNLIPAVRQSPKKSLWSSYHAEADVLYISFRKPGYATDSELTDNDVIVRYDNDEMIGLTILHASTR